MTKICVIIEGQLRGGSVCGENIRKKVVDFLGADLMIFCQICDQIDHDHDLKYYGPTKYTMMYNNPTQDGFDKIFDDMRTCMNVNEDWRMTFDKVIDGNYKLGYDKPGTCIQMMYNRHIIWYYLISNNLLGYYDWYIVLRSDMYFLTDFPDLNTLTKGHIYTVNREEDTGLNNNSIIFSGDIAGKVLNYVEEFINCNVAKLKGIKGRLDEEGFFARAINFRNVPIEKISNMPLNNISYLLEPQSNVSITLEGGLGNQLFKVFCLINYSITYNKKYIINRNIPKHNNLKLDIRHTYWSNLFKTIYEHSYEHKRHFKHQYNEKKFCEYNEIPYYKTNILLKGYYQSYKYFETKYDEIINILNLNETQNSIKTKYLKNENIISLHFRKGDYKNLNNFILLNNFYYKEAIRYVLDKDTSKCSEILCVYEKQDEEEVCNMIEELKDIFSKIKFIKVSHELEDWEQMILMSICKHNIIANSTFSWWSAYINKNVDKIVCYPEEWLVKSINTSDMFPKKWNMIKNNNSF